MPDRIATAEQQKRARAFHAYGNDTEAGHVQDGHFYSGEVTLPKWIPALSVEITKGRPIVQCCFHLFLFVFHISANNY